MSFLAPWALLLAAAAGVPLLLHLLRRRTGVKLDFPAVRYLLRMEKEHAREVRLRNLLLMVLRVAIILALAFAAARPIGPLPGVGHAPVAVALVLDNSLSSAAVGAEGPMLVRLTTVARAMVDGASAADQLWIVTLDGAVTGGSPATLRDALSRVRALDGAGDATGALRRAATLVQQSGIPNRRVVLLTDGQAASWRDATVNVGEGVTLSVVQPNGAPPANRAVVAVATEPAHWNPRGAIRATVSGTDSTTWRVIIGERTLARGSAQAGATVLARLQPLARGWVAGAIELAPDELRADDIRHFAAHIGEPPAITTDAASGLFLRGAVDALVQGGRAVRAGGGTSNAVAASAVAIVSAERARKPGLLFAPTDPLKLADANRALERAGIPWRFGARRDGPAPLRGEGLDGAVARRWHPLTPAGDISASDTVARVGGAPWAVAGEGYVLVASAADASATDLPVRAAFIPWLDMLLSQRLAQGTGAAIAAVPGATVRVPTGVDALEAPDGSTRAVIAGAAVIAPWTAGVHFWRRGGERAGALVVNGEPRESDLARLTPDSLAALLNASMAPADAGAATAALYSAGGRRTLARTFLVLALLLLVAESIVARRGIFKPAPA